MRRFEVEFEIVSGGGPLGWAGDAALWIRHVPRTGDASSPLLFLHQDGTDGTTVPFFDF